MIRISCVHSDILTIIRLAVKNSGQFIESKTTEAGLARFSWEVTDVQSVDVQWNRLDLPDVHRPSGDYGSLLYALQFYHGIRPGFE